MRTHKVIASILCVLLPGTVLAKEKTSLPPFEIIRYQLPSATVSAKISLTLESCAGEPIVSGEATIAADADAASPSFALNTAQLESARVKRTLNITLQDSGTIATIDSNAEDRTGSIIGNVIKFVASVAGAFFGTNVPKAAFVQADTTKNKAVVCTEPVQAALARVVQIDAVLTQWRATDLPASAKEAQTQSQAINALIAERAALRTGPLHVDLDMPLNMANLTQPDQNQKAVWTATTQVDMKPLQKAWLKEDTTAKGQTITAVWTITLPANSTIPKDDQQPAALCQAKLDTVGGQGICFAIPAIASFKVTVSSNKLQLKDSSFTLEAAKGFPIPQWGTLQVLGLSAGFGSNKQMSLTLNKFGQVSMMKWTSEARAESVTASMAGIASQVNDVVAANNKLARDKAEIDELTTKQSLNRIKACQQILDAGGSACPADATPQTPQ